MPTAIVVELGRSQGGAAIAAGIALALARTLEAGWVLLAELDPRGGNLLEKLVLGGDPRTDADRDVPAGARELTEQLAGVDLDRTLLPQSGAGSRPALTGHLVEVARVAKLRVLLGDPLLEGATRAAARIMPVLPDLARTVGAGAVIVDGGPWASTAAAPTWLMGADVVYAVVQADSASQNSRCQAELAALWRLVQSTSPRTRLVAVVTDPAWSAPDLRLVFDQQPPAGSGQRRYRVAIMGGRRDRRLLDRLAAGAWQHLSDKSLDPFFELASPLTNPLGEQLALSAASPLAAPASCSSELSPTHGSPPGSGSETWIARAVTGPSAGGRPVPAPATGRPPAAAALDPGYPASGPAAWWPFADGDGDSDGDGDGDETADPDDGLSPAMEAARRVELVGPHALRALPPPRRLRPLGHVNDHRIGRGRDHRDDNKEDDQ